MILSLSTLLILVPILLLIEGFFSGAEIALISADRLSLEKRAKGHVKGASIALKLIHHPEQIFSTTLLMTSLCVIGISALITVYIHENMQGSSEWIAVLITSPIVVIFGELIPKAVYRKFSTKWAPWIAYPVAISYRIFYPATKILSMYTTRLSKMVRPIEELVTGVKRTTRDEIRSMLMITRDDTEIHNYERQMIDRIFDFKDTLAKHALIPLVNVDAIEESSTLQEALEKFSIHRHSRMPIYSERIYNIVGILEFPRIASISNLTDPVKMFSAQAHYVSDTQPLPDVLSDMKANEAEMTVVVDEHGGAIGILTFEDIVENIVGEIHDEDDPDKIPYKKVSEMSWLVLARAKIQRLNEELQIELPEGDYETLSGFLLQQFSRIPAPKDELFFDTPAGSYKFTIKNATARRIENVLIEKLEVSPKD